MRGLAVKALLVGVLIFSMVSSSGGSFVPSEEEIKEVLGEIEIQRIDSTLDSRGMAGKLSDKVANWSASSSYEVLYEGEVDSTLHIYETTKPSLEEAKGLFFETLQEVVKSTDIIDGKYAEVLLGKENDPDQEFIFITVFYNNGIMTSSFADWIRVENTVTMVEQTKSFLVTDSDAGKYKISVDRVIGPVSDLIIKKMVQVSNLRQMI